MPKNYYLPTDDAGKAELLEHLAARLPFYAEQLNVSTGELSSLNADASAYRYTMTMNNQAQHSAKNWVAFKNQLRDGGANGNGSFPPISLAGGAAPEAVAPGIIPRLTTFVTRLKTAPNYTEAIGQDLGLIGTVRVVDPSVWQPAIATHTEAGRPVLAWSKGGADALEIWVERTPQGGFVALDISTDTRYQDDEPTPATPAVWRYKAIFRLKDEPVGNWSDVASVVVGG
ncbi:MAG TPA: hypothetical protein PK229_04325 [Rhodocyclaceae bacterium]|uniref:hypothetical protein n=1 Tax=Zoogloea sp. TaxID=49181 RepID=UPI002BF3C44D|nr:hypothetical protein [Zoogloea sp.]HMW53849.1 hypothetical protein [Rhodocyclaceae bacterium]HNA68385.1 hypothetical protein [Rhodocyclaceae bacterium]HNC81241.1 hypothetical protein [Rhodocyclaceae bacterium]HND23519.1 hypothetical protein [Rhodocyclaceae bacterium]HNH18176.1 hypothetical protein [Zoogloea sp.]